MCIYDYIIYIIICTYIASAFWCPEEVPYFRGEVGHGDVNFRARLKEATFHTWEELPKAQCTVAHGPPKILH